MGSQASKGDVAAEGNAAAADAAAVKTNGQVGAPTSLMLFYQREKLALVEVGFLAQKKLVLLSILFDAEFTMIGM